jgi:hypothetical protein
MNKFELLLATPLIALDCLGNLLLGGSWRNTISGEAWMNRTPGTWGDTYMWIDAIFGDGHCKKQAETEAVHGSVWAAVWADLTS